MFFHFYLEITGTFQYFVCHKQMCSGSPTTWKYLENGNKNFAGHPEEMKDLKQDYSLKYSVNIHND